MRAAFIAINPTIGDIRRNGELIAKGIERARSAGADLAVFPELALCGYPPKDLLLQHGFLDRCGAEMRRLGEGLTQGLTAVFGAPMRITRAGTRSNVANGLAVYRNNEFVDSYEKQLLPTYDVFDEDRYFQPGIRNVVLDVGGIRVGLAICEDLWRGVDAGLGGRYSAASDPVKGLIDAGAELIVSPSASPFVLGKATRHLEIVASHATRHGISVASLNQLGGNDELVFDGHAIVCDGAEGTMASMPRWKGGAMIVDFCARGRMLRASWGGGDSGSCEGAIDSACAESPMADLFEALVLGIRDYLGKTGFRKAIIGLSGGIDSALTAALAVAALGAQNVMGVLMPSRFSSADSVADAEELAQRLGMPHVTIGIEPAVNSIRGAINPVFADISELTLGSRVPDIADENLQSRVRGTIVMAISNRTGAMVLTTGNKSEMGVGYCTLYGDMNGGLAVLSDVTKMTVYEISSWINEKARTLGFATAPIPQRSIDKAPSAELRPDQTDQDSLPPYADLDRVLEEYIERHGSLHEIVTRTGLDAALVARVMRMVDIAEYKRKQAAIGLKVTGVAFGSGRRWPIAHGYRHELES